MSVAPILQLKGISKSFGPTQALQSASLNLFGGEVHAVMGENGAGKSTLIKILTGVYGRDRGEILLRGNLIWPQSNADAQALGISTVYQEVNLIPDLSVAENIFIGREPRRFGMIDWRTVYARATTALSRLQLNLDVRRPLGEYPIAIQQLVAIARALDVQASILVLDEVTSSLDRSEVEQLFSILARLRKEGMAILLVTHFLDQVYQISDRITVLRNGSFVGEWESAQLTKPQLVAKMMGYELTTNDARAIAKDEQSSSVWLKCKGYGINNSLGPFDLEIRRHEMLGLAGLLGSGRTEVARLIFGLDRADTGSLEIDGQAQDLVSPRKAVEHGLALLPEDRKTQSIFPQLSVSENLTMALQARRGWLSPVRREERERLTSEFISALRIKTAGGTQLIETLSGGNQQKVLLARWLILQPRLLILDEPTRGIDVGAKAEIQKLISGLVEKGLSVLFISSDLEETVRLCDRVLVLKDRKIVTELKHLALSESSIMRQIAKENEASL